MTDPTHLTFYIEDKSGQDHPCIEGEDGKFLYVYKDDKHSSAPRVFKVPEVKYTMWDALTRKPKPQPLTYEEKAIQAFDYMRERAITLSRTRGSNESEQIADMLATDVGEDS